MPPILKSRSTLSFLCNARVGEGVTIALHPNGKARASATDALGPSAQHVAVSWRTREPGAQLT